MINIGNSGNISGFPAVDNLNQPAVAPTPNPGVSAAPVPDAGWHVTLTDPIMWGIVTINGSPWTPSVSPGLANTVLTTDGTGAVAWLPAVQSIDFGTTGLLPTPAATGHVSVSGVLNLANGGTGLNTVGVNGTALVSNGTTISYSYPARANNIAGGDINQIPYQSAANATSFIAAGVTGQILKANTGAAPTWGAGTATIGTTPITLGTTIPSLAGVTTITLTQDPVNGLEAATKQYVDSRTGALRPLGNAKVATTGNITRNGPQTIDTIPVVAGDIVLVRAQSNAAENGIYEVQAGAWTYPTYADVWSEYVGGLVFVLQGFTYANTSWTQTGGPGGTLGVTNMYWAQISAALDYNAGAGIDITGAVISNTGVLSFAGGTTGLTPAAATTGAITLAGTLAPANGGTGITALGTSVQTALGTAVNTVNGFVTFSGNLGTPSAGVLTNATGLPLTSGVTGVLPIANGGTGNNTANDAINALLPVQTSQAGKFLMTNGGNVSWETNPSGTVTSVEVTGGTTGLTFGGTNPVTTSGTIVMSGTLGAASGGTGLTSYTAGDILYATAATTLAKLPIGSAGQVLTVTAGAPSWQASGGLIGYTNSVSPFNTALGANAGDSITSGTDNVCIGYNAGTAITSGGNIVAIGSGALDAAAIPTNCIAIGRDALGTTTLAVNNIAIGASALGAGGAGSNNVAVGTGAAQATTTATQNTIVGNLAGANITSGGSNVAIGYQSLDACNTGSQNIAIGVNSLGAATTGASNVAVGHNALAVSTTTSNNVAVGTSAGTNISSGTFNALLGNSAGLALTTASNNALVGYQAGDALNTGGNNTALGSNALGAATTSTDNTAIGQNAGLIVTGSFNTFVGSEAGGGTGSFTGNYCVGIGYGALNSTVTTSEAIGIGRDALTALTNGTNNCVVGSQSGITVSTGSENTTLGNLSFRLGTGSQNVAIGYAALQNAATGDNIIAIGRSAAQVTTASGSVAIGRDALLNTTTGISTAVGYQALRSNITGANSTAVGYNALTAATGGTNTAVGHGAGSAITTGSSNTLVGAYAGTTTLTGVCAMSDGAGNIRLYTNSAGAFSMDGTNFGAIGDVLTSNGTANRPTWNTPAWAWIYDTNGQQFPLGDNVQTTIGLNSIDANSSGVSIVSGTRITFARAGTYVLTPSVQVANLDSNEHEFNLWLGKNGTSIALSARRYTVAKAHAGGDAYVMATVSYTLKLNANDYIELYWSTESSANVSLNSLPVIGSVPAAPLVVVAVSQV